MFKKIKKFLLGLFEEKKEYPIGWSPASPVLSTSRYHIFVDPNLDFNLTEHFDTNYGYRDIALLYFLEKNWKKLSLNQILKDPSTGKLHLIPFELVSERIHKPDTVTIDYELSGVLYRIPSVSTKKFGFISFFDLCVKLEKGELVENTKVLTPFIPEHKLKETPMFIITAEPDKVRWIH